MTDQEKTQKILEIYRSLPAELQNALTDSDISTKVRTIANKHNLHIDKISMLELDVMLVLLGIEPVSEFVNSISKQLQVPQSEAESIAADVHDSIFHSVTDALRGVETEMKELDEQEANQPATSSTMNTSFTTPMKHGLDDIGQLESHAEILHAIENPEQYKAQPMITPKSTMQISPELQSMIQSVSKPTPTSTTSPTAAPAQSIQSILTPNTNSTADKPHDPYREPIL